LRRGRTHRVAQQVHALVVGAVLRLDIGGHQVVRARRGSEASAMPAGRNSGVA
jgi:hypothetical protein